MMQKHVLFFTCFGATSTSTHASPIAAAPRLSDQLFDERQLRDGPEMGKQEPSPGLGSAEPWSFLDEQGQRGLGQAVSHQVAVDPAGQLSKFNFMDAVEAAHNKHLQAMQQMQEPRKHAFESFVEKAQDNSPSDEKEDEEFGAETPGGAPNDHWRDCATTDGSCECYKGEVRFGTKTQDIWTMPVHMGTQQTVTCSVKGMQEARVHNPTKTGAESPRQCQCIERDIRIHATVTSSLLQETRNFNSERHGNLPPSMLQEEERTTTSTASIDYSSAMSSGVGADAPCGLYAGEECKMCLYVPDHNVEGLLQERDRSGHEARTPTDMELFIAKQLDTDVAIKECDGGDEEIWTYLLSSGQMRHDLTGKCLGTFFKDGESFIKAQDCNANAESQHLIQRWVATHYSSPGFEQGKGKLELGYGQHSAHPLCLNADSIEKISLKECGSSSTQWEFETTTEAGPHRWFQCQPHAEENQECSCGGEVRFGDGEAEKWTASVPIPTQQDVVASFQCSLEILRELAVEDPVAVEDIEDPKHRDCQCRNSHPLPSGAKSESDKSNLPMYAGIGVVALAVVGGGAFFMSQKKSNDYYAEEYEGEYEEEYEEYEE